MRTYTMTAVIWKEGKAYVSKCPETGVASCGDTPEGALHNLKEAVELYLENASPSQGVSPRSYTPKHLAEKILTSRSALEGERKQVTVLFADVKGSMGAG